MNRENTTGPALEITPRVRGGDITNGSEYRIAPSQLTGVRAPTRLVAELGDAT